MKQINCNRGAENVSNFRFIYLFCIKIGRILLHKFFVFFFGSLFKKKRFNDIIDKEFIVHGTEMGRKISKNVIVCPEREDFFPGGKADRRR